MDYLSEKLDELTLTTAYEQTNYRILDPEIIIKCGEFNASIDAYMKQIGKRNWTFITASNPKSKQQSAKHNGWSNANLEMDLAKTKCVYTYGIGEAINGDWPGEESFIVFNMSLDTAINLAKKYNQNAILIGRIDAKSKLQWIDHD